MAGQERELREHASRRGWTVEAVFAEKTSASGRVEREAFQRLLQAARLPRRGWGRVLVWSLDRWSREPSFVRAIGTVEELEQLGLRFHSLKEPALDSGEDDGPSLARDILRGILPAIAAFEARRRAERTQLAMDEIRSGRRPTRSGRPVGRPRKVLDSHVRQIRELRETPRPDGRRRTWAEIARMVHLPAGTCKNVYRASRHGKPRVEKGPDGFGAADGG